MNLFFEAFLITSAIVLLAYLYLMSGSKKKLIILDLNGLLVHRHFKRSSIETGYNTEEATLLGDHYTWDRPGSREFINYLLDNYTVAVWSSAMAKNVNLLVNHVFKSRRTELLFEFDQSFCELETPHPDPTERKPLFKKNLTTVWSAFSTFNERNTLLIDDSKYKTRDNPKGTVLLVDSWHPLKSASFLEIQENLEIWKGLQ